MAGAFLLGAELSQQASSHHSSLPPSQPGAFKNSPPPAHRRTSVAVEAGSGPSAAGVARGPTLRTLTLVSAQWVMQPQQNRWPQGVAVEYLRSSRHRVHSEVLETALSV